MTVRARGDCGDIERSALAARIARDAWRLDILRVLQAETTTGVDAWVAAGFVRNLVWDRDFGSGRIGPLEDVDVLIFDPADRVSREPEQSLEAELRRRRPSVPWSVRNQARMHRRSDDRPYNTIEDAMRHWLETATGIAVRLGTDDRLQIISAYGLDDLLAGILRPTESGLSRPEELRARIDRKGWRARWPGVRFLVPTGAIA